jgi:hypothetical protein
MDELKKYLQNHAEELNLDEPRPQVWQNIQQETQAAKKRPVIVMITRWAAAACILALAGIGAWYMISEKKTEPCTDSCQQREKPIVNPILLNSNRWLLKIMSLLLLPKQQIIQQTQTRNTQHTTCKQPGNTDQPAKPRKQFYTGDQPAA